MKKSIIVLVVSSLLFMNVSPLVSYAENKMIQKSEDPSIDNNTSDQSIPTEEDYNKIEGEFESNSNESIGQEEFLDSQTNVSELISEETKEENEQQKLQTEKESDLTFDSTQMTDSNNKLTDTSEKNETFADVVTIPDLNLRKLINTRLKHISDWESYTPTKQELASINGHFRLDFNTTKQTQFTSLEGVQYLTGISELYAYYVTFMNLDDLNLISMLKQLTYISMGDTNIDNMAFAASLPNLTGMVLPRNNISDVRASLDYYNSPKRRQYNFLNQSITKTITLESGQSVVDPLAIIGINGNPVLINYQNSTNRFKFENGKFIGNNLVPGQTYIIKYYFIDTSINHVGALNGFATINVRIPLLQAADVTVRYEDPEGKELAPTKILSGNLGETYTSEQIEIPDYTFKEVRGATSGKFTSEAQTVTYIYTKTPVKGADVTVRYEDPEGKELAPTEILSGNLEETYTSEQIEIPDYTFKEVRGAASGKFTSEAQTVTYIYTKKPVKGADVTVRYEDPEGKELAPTEILSGNLEETYTSEQIEIPDYTFKEVRGATSGKFTSEAQTVTYIYTKKPVKGADVTVRYEDPEGKELAPTKILSGNLEETYTSEQIEIPDYTFKEVRGAASGKFTSEAQTVTYIYTKTPVKGADVTVRYEDPEGKKLAPTKILSGNLEETYTSEQIEIPDYTFKEVRGAASGKFTSEAQTVTYIYTKIPIKGADVTVRYEDPEGKELAPTKILSGNIGDPYTSEQLAIEGYVFKNVEGNSTGNFTAEAQEITYVYTKQTVNGNHGKLSDTLDKKHQTQNIQPNLNNSSTISSTYQKTFPKTGEKQGLGKQLSVLGGIIIILLTGLFIWNKRKSSK